MISISTRVASGISSGVNRSIDFFRRSGIETDGIELTFLRPADVWICSGGGILSRENKKFVKGLDFCTMHLPWKNVSFNGAERIYIRLLSECYSRLECRVAVVHPDCVKDGGTYDWLNDMFPGLSVENMTPAESGHRYGSTIKDVEEILSSNKELGMVMDFSHCMAGGEGFSQYEQKFKRRIKEVHVSAYCGSCADSQRISRHEMLHNSGRDIESGLKNVPWVIEGKSTDADSIKAEIKYLKRIMQKG